MKKISFNLGLFSIVITAVLIQFLFIGCENNSGNSSLSETSASDNNSKLPDHSILRFKLNILDSSSTSDEDLISTKKTDSNNINKLPSGTIKSIFVNVIKTEIHHAEKGWLTLQEENKIYDLLDLTSNINNVLGPYPMMPGRYTQVRLILGEENSIVMDVNGIEKTYPLKIPSAQKNGIKLVRSFNVEQGKFLQIYVDIDINRIVFVHHDQYCIINPVLRTIGVEEFDGIAEVGPEGGDIISYDNVSVMTIPPGALDEATVITYKELTNHEIPGLPFSKTGEFSYFTVGKVYEIYIEDKKILKKPYSFKTRYSSEEEQSIGLIREAGIESHVFNHHNRKWERLVTNLDPVENTIEFLYDRSGITGNISDINIKVLNNDDRSAVQPVDGLERIAKLVWDHLPASCDNECDDHHDRHHCGHDHEKKQGKHKGHDYDKRCNSHGNHKHHHHNWYFHDHKCSSHEEEINYNNHCSGYLVSENYLLTASNCVFKDGDVNRQYFCKEPGVDKIVFPGDDVWFCESVKFVSLDPLYNTTLLKVQKKNGLSAGEIKGFFDLYRAKPVVALDTLLYGYDNFLDSFVADSSTDCVPSSVNYITSLFQSDFFTHKCDAVYGESGGPVISRNNNNLVLGLNWGAIDSTFIPSTGFSTSSVAVMSGEFRNFFDTSETLYDIVRKEFPRVLGGTVSGLTGTLTISVNTPSGDFEVRDITQNGDFTFSTQFPDGFQYGVLVVQHPAGQVCNVANGYGEYPYWNTFNGNTITITCETSSEPPGFPDGGTGDVIGRTISGNEEIRVRLNPSGALQMITSLDSRFVFSGLYTYNKDTGDIKVDYTSAECVNCVVPGTVYPIDMFSLGTEYRDFTLVDWTSDWLKVRRKVSGEELLFTTCSVFNPYDDSQLILY